VICDTKTTRTFIQFQRVQVAQNTPVEIQQVMLRPSCILTQQPSISVSNARLKRGILLRIPHYPQFQRRTASRPALILQTLLINPKRKRSLFKSKMKGFPPLPFMIFLSPRGFLQTCIARCSTSTQLNKPSLLWNIKRPTCLDPPQQFPFSQYLLSLKVKGTVATFLEVSKDNQEMITFSAVIQDSALVKSLE